MNILNARFRNFKCFEEFSIDFSSKHRTHVILAENMAGKSALMAALRIGASSYLGKIYRPSHINFKQQDHRVIGLNPLTDLALEIVVEMSVRMINHNGSTALNSFYKYKEQVKGVRTKKQSSVYISQGTQFVLDPEGKIAEIAKKVYDKAIQGEAQLPLLNYIGTEYIHSVRAETVKFDLQGSALQAYQDCFTDKSIQKYLFSWLGRIDGIMAEAQRKPLLAELYGDLPAKAMEVFRRAVLIMLPDVKAVDWSADAKQPVLKLDDRTVRLFDMLSDGYKYLVLLAGELATRAVLLNKHLTADEVFAKTEGLVLIDEFGIHLHPSLQGDALKRLEQLFPKVQYIITTHSPMLLNGLKKEQIHMLSVNEDGSRTVRHPDEDVIGMGANGILTQLFGLSTTLDAEYRKASIEYGNLVKRSEQEELSHEDQVKKTTLRGILSKNQLDPEIMHVAQDPITEEVKKRMKAQSKGKKISADQADQAKKTIDDVLKEMFSPNRKPLT